MSWYRDTITKNSAHPPTRAAQTAGSVSVEYRPDLSDYLAIAAEIAGTDLKTITSATKTQLSTKPRSSGIARVRSSTACTDLFVPCMASGQNGVF